MNKYLKFEYWNTCDLGNIYYQGGQKFMFYLDADVGEPLHEDIEEGQENGDGDFIPTYRRQIKRYRIRTGLIPDFLIDAMQRMKLHDNIELTFKTGEVEQIYNVDIEPEWQFEKYAWQGTVTMTFDMDESITVGACCDNLVVGISEEEPEPEPIPDLYWVAENGSDLTGDGSYTRPWATLAYACTQAVSVGDVIHVAAGTYTETMQSVLAEGVSITGVGVTSIITTAAALNPIIYAASPIQNSPGNQSISSLAFDGDNVAVMGIHVRARSNVIVRDCSFIDFTDNGLRFTGLVSGSGEPTNYAVNNSVHDCTFTNCGGETYSAPNYFASAAIGFSGQSNAEAYDNHIDNTLGNYAYGINTNGIGYNRGLKIHDNTILISPKHVSTNQWQFSIELWTCRGGIEIYNNTLSGGVDLGGVSTSDVGGYGFAARINNNIIALPTIQAYDHTGVIIESDISGGVYVFNNIIKNYNYGLTMNALSGPTDTMEDIYVYNNLFIETTKNSNYSGRAIASGNDGDSFSDIYLYNNTCYTYSYKASAGFHFATSGAVFNNINIRNNIFNNAYNAVRFENNTIAGLHIDNNCFYGQTNAVSFVSVTASDTTRSGNLYSTDPLFRSSGYYRLQSTSPCINAGLSVGLTSDFAGHRVPQNDTVDIGAYEYGNYLFRTPSGHLLRNANGKLMITH